MKFLKQFIEQPIFPLTLMLLVAGAAIYDDYGISWDEPQSRANGAATANHLRTLWYQITDPAGANNRSPMFTLDSFGDNIYGVAIELPLFACEMMLGIEDDYHIYQLRHLLNFIIFTISILFFYLILINRFGSPKWAILGCALLILSPRIFAQSFYNSKDLAFMAVFIICLYTLIRFLEIRTLKYALIHGITTAILINTRMPGVIIIPLTLAFFPIACWNRKGRLITFRNTVSPLLCYIVSSVIMTILFWPYLWDSPFEKFIAVFSKMSQYPWRGYVYYFGQFIRGSDIPWHYIPVWIGLTTPLLYQLAFLLGAISISSKLFSSPVVFLKSEKSWLDLLFLTVAILPLVAVLVSGSTLYGGWRHLFFIYPGIVLVAVVGIRLIWQSTFKFKGNAQKLSHSILLLAIITSSLGTLYFMIRYHPHQYAYFNLIGRHWAPQFDQDYWGLSYKQAMEHILKNDQSSSIRIAFENTNGWHNLKALNKHDREKIVHVLRENLRSGDYFISNYNFTTDRERHFQAYQNKDFPYLKEIYRIDVSGTPIMSVYQIP